RARAVGSAPRARSPADRGGPRRGRSSGPPAAGGALLRAASGLDRPERERHLAPGRERVVADRLERLSEVLPLALDLGLHRLRARNLRSGLRVTGLRPRGLRTACRRRHAGGGPGQEASRAGRHQLEKPAPRALAPGGAFPTCALHEISPRRSSPGSGPRWYLWTASAPTAYGFYASSSRSSSHNARAFLHST